MNKREWIDEYKKNTTNLKLEEKNLINSFLNEDFHLNKIYMTMMRDEVDGERKILEEAIKQLKTSVEDVYMYFKGNIGKVRNFDLRQKIYKIDEMIGKIRIEFKNKFEIFLMEEDKLEMELELFEKGLEFNNIRNKNNFNDQNEDEENFLSNFEEDENIHLNELNKNKIKLHSLQSPNDKIDEFIQYVMNTANIIFDDFSLEDITKIIQRMTYKDMELIKKKINQVEIIMEKNLGGPNLNWQPRDHQEFLKLRSAHNNKINTFEFLNDLENAIPFIPRSELKNHIKFFNKFYQLNELKKILIFKYKELKQEKDANDKKEILEKITNEKRPSTAKPTNVDNKQKLDEWKKKKLLEKKELYELKLQEEQIQKEKFKIKYLEKSQQIKPMLEEYKKIKTIKKMEDEENENNLFKNSIMISEIDLERIKEKNEKLIQKKMLIVKSKSLNNIKKAENYTKYKIKKMEKLENITPKLNEKTEGFQMKQRKKFDKENDVKRDANTMANNVLGRMTRAIPQWRQSLI